MPQNVPGVSGRLTAFSGMNEPDPTAVSRGVPGRSPRNDRDRSGDGALRDAWSQIKAGEYDQPFAERPFE